MPAESEASITHEIASFFKRVEATTTSELTAVIQEEERGIKQTVELNQREQDQREAALAKLAETAAAVAEHRVALQRALVLARQTG
jgi:hypothetical protein